MRAGEKGGEREKGGKEKGGNEKSSRDDERQEVVSSRRRRRPRGDVRAFFLHLGRIHEIIIISQ